jgi:hypothetical protein
MSFAKDSDIGRLQKWYSAQCDGQWEHQYGVEIGTIDNPGWSLRVDLAGTDLSGKRFDNIRVREKSENDWYDCSIVGDRFEGVCGPRHLGVVIDIFCEWAARESSPT